MKHYQVIVIKVSISFLELFIGKIVLFVKSLSTNFSILFLSSDIDFEIIFEMSPAEMILIKRKMIPTIK